MWSRVIVHVDMDAFFASIEQRDFPALRGKPVCITNGKQGSCIITRSYEARAFGIKTGMRLREARKLCPHLIQQSTRPYHYVKISSEIMQVLETISPAVEVFSVDEAFLDLTECQRIYQSPKQVGLLIKERVFAATQLVCSVGVSGDRTTAKYASKSGKPDGLRIIPPWQTAAALAPLPVSELCGIARGMTQFLAQYGVYRCGDITKIPINVLAQRFGNLGRRIWYMCQGQDPEPLHLVTPDPKSMGHGKVMPPNTKDKSTILVFLSHMAEKLGCRLRHNQFKAQTFRIALRLGQGWLSTKMQTTLPTNDGGLIYQLAKQLVECHWQGEGVFQCQLTALDPQPVAGQMDLFTQEDTRQQRLNGILDQVNEKFGQGSLCHGNCVTPLTTPDVIAPAWRPKGHREL